MTIAVRTEAFKFDMFASAGIVPQNTGCWSLMRLHAQWLERHRDPRVQRMAECFLESFLQKKRRQEAPRAVAS